MVGRRRTRKKTAGSHQRCWLWGRHAVLESLRTARWLPETVWHASDLDSETLSEVHSLATSAGVELHAVDVARLTQLVGTVEHQGLAGRMPEFLYDSVDLLENASDSALWLVLDRIQDPHNFGAILRSVNVLGGSGVVVGEVGQAAVTPHVARSSAGAVHHVPIVRVIDLRSYLQVTQLPVLVATADAATTIDQVNFRRPVLVVLGNEGDGVSPELLALAHQRVAIPQQGRISSLNVGVAAGIILYEARRQRTTAG